MKVYCKQCDFAVIATDPLKALAQGHKHNKENEDHETATKIGYKPDSGEVEFL